MLPGDDGPGMRLTAVRRAQIDAFDPERPPDRYDLTERGQVQARLLGARLAREAPPDTVYTGDSDRHRDTARVVAGTVAAVTSERPPVETVTDLNDVAWTMDALRTCHQEQYGQVEWTRRWAAGELDIDEDITSIRKRVSGVADELVHAHEPNDHILFVTSAVPVQVLVCAALGTMVGETQLPVANCAAFTFDWTADERTTETLTDTAHLPGELVTRDGFVDRD